MPRRQYASLQDAAEYLSCHVRTIRRMISRGEVTAYKVGRVIRVDLNELDEAVRVVPTAAVGGGSDAA